MSAYLFHKLFSMEDKNIQDFTENWPRHYTNSMLKSEHQLCNPSAPYDQSLYPVYTPIC